MASLSGVTAAYEPDSDFGLCLSGFAVFAELLGNVDDCADELAGFSARLVVLVVFAGAPDVPRVAFPFGDPPFLALASADFPREPDAVCFWFLPTSPGGVWPVRPRAIARRRAFARSDALAP